MKLFTVLAVLLLAVQLCFYCSAQLDPDYTFEEYIIQFQKQYEDDEEKEFRREVFNRNYQRILQANEEANGTV